MCSCVACDDAVSMLAWRRTDGLLTWFCSCTCRGSAERKRQTVNKFTLQSSRNKKCVRATGESVQVVVMMARRKSGSRLRREHRTVHMAESYTEPWVWETVWVCGVAAHREEAIRLHSLHSGNWTGSEGGFLRKCGAQLRARSPTFTQSKL